MTLRATRMAQIKAHPKGTSFGAQPGGLGLFCPQQGVLD